MTSGKADPFLDAAVRQLARLAAKRPHTTEARHARLVCRRARYYRARSLLLPRTRRYVLSELRSATKALERLDHRD